MAGPSISVPRFTYNAVNAAKTLCTQGKISQNLRTKFIYSNDQGNCILGNDYDCNGF